MQSYDEFCARLQDIADMPNHTAELLFGIEQRYDALFGQAGGQPWAYRTRKTS